MCTHGACEAAWECFPLVRASAAHRGQTGLALHAMLRCVASEQPQISWQARDASAALAGHQSDSLPADSAAELADCASVVSAPLLVPCAGRLSGEGAHGRVCATTRTSHNPEIVCECAFNDLSGSSPGSANSLTSVAMQVHQPDALSQCVVHAGVWRTDCMGDQWRGRRPG